MPFSPLKFYALDQDNHVVEVEDCITWGRWFEDATSQRQVGYTQITSEISVSTVFLGVDHRFPGFPSGPPILFETLVFGGPLDGDGNRYSSWDDAEIGHKAFVRLARAYQEKEHGRNQKKHPQAFWSDSRGGSGKHDPEPSA